MAGLIEKEAALDRLGGDEDLYLEIANVFLEDTPRQLRVLQDALQRDERGEFTRIAHSLKSASGTIGAESMRLIAAKLERIGATAHCDELTECVRELEQLFAAVRTHFSAK